jgi:hypothetical protein
MKISSVITKIAIDYFQARWEQIYNFYHGML